jgi:Uma2 family endonuclease
MSRTLSHPASSRPSASPSMSLDDVQHIVLDGVSWDFYERLLREIGGRPLRVTYDQGRMEIMSPLPEHERPKTVIARLIEMLTYELDMPMLGLGSTTFRRKDKAKGLEPDECLYFRDEVRMRGCKRWNPKKDPPPQLVVEIDITSRSIDREPIYAALGVLEIWRHDGRRIQCLELTEGVYRLRKHSLAFPFLQPAQLQQFVGMVPTRGETATIKAFATWVRKNGWSKGD